MKVQEVEAGKIIRTIIFGCPGNYYRVYGMTHWGKVRARRQFTQEVVYLHPTVKCEVQTEPVEGFN